MATTAPHRACGFFADRSALQQLLDTVYTGILFFFELSFHPKFAHEGRRGLVVERLTQHVVHRFG
jgi:hypothetical protein